MAVNNNFFIIFQFFRFGDGCQDNSAHRLPTNCKNNEFLTNAETI